MAQQLINIGVTADDGTGDTIRGAGIKINENFTELFPRPSVQSQINIIQNEILATESNSDIVLAGSGTGIVQITDLTVDGTIRMSDNHIRVNTSNADLVLTANGTGTVQTANTDINGGNIDGTVIGATTPLSGTFTTITTTTSAQIDGVYIQDHDISASDSDADLELSASGSGNIIINGVIGLPNTDGTMAQVLKTDGSGQLDWITWPTVFDNVLLEDGTATVLGSSSSAQVIDSWSASTYRSVKYHIQITDATADRYRLIDANVTHDGSTAYISSFGGVDNGAGDGSSVYDTIDLSTDISGGNVRLLGTVNNTNDQIVKLVKRSVKV